MKTLHAKHLHITTGLFLLLAIAPLFQNIKESYWALPIMFFGFPFYIFDLFISTFFQNSPNYHSICDLPCAGSSFVGFEIIYAAWLIILILLFFLIIKLGKSLWQKNDHV